MSSYITVRGSASDEFTVKHSRFIGHIMPVTTREQAEQFIAQVSKKHWDATHNVYAYVLRDGQMRRYSDDGEPQGTAGIPVLDVLLKSGLTDCAVVVTRYFGGIMLGAGGLVRAYSHAASLAVEAGGIVTRALCQRLEVKCDYNFYGKLAAAIPNEGGVIENTAFEDSVRLVFRLRSDSVGAFNNKLTDMSSGRFFSEKIEEIYCDID